MKKLFVAAALFLGMTSFASANMPGYVCNDNSNVANVRSGPSAQDYRIIDKVDNGQNVTILDTTYNAAGFMWAKVRYNSFRYGYHSVETGWIDASAVCRR